MTTEATPFLEITCKTATTNDYKGIDTGLLCSQQFKFGSITDKTAVLAGFQSPVGFGCVPFLHNLHSTPADQPIEKVEVG